MNRQLAPATAILRPRRAKAPCVEQEGKIATIPTEKARMGLVQPLAAPVQATIPRLIAVAIVEALIPTLATNVDPRNERKGREP